MKIIKTSCRACIASCAVLAHVRDGRVVKIEGNPESPMSQGGVCAKGLAGIQALYHPNRNKYPMRRVGERGSNQWERISWEEALTEVCDQDQRSVRQVRLRGHLRFHGRRRKPALLEREALRRGMQQHCP